MGTAHLVELEAVLERHDAVEHFQLVGGILVLAEVGGAHELEVLADLRFGEPRLRIAAHNRQGIRVELLAAESGILGFILGFLGFVAGVFIQEEHVVQASLEGHILLRADPMDGTLDLAVRARHAGLGVKVDGAVDAGHVAVFVDIPGIALDDVSALEANLAFRLEADIYFLFPFSVARVFFLPATPKEKS